jgi:hypothetical protein
MRNNKTVSVTGGKALVQEFRVSDIRSLLQQASELQDDLEIMTLFSEDSPLAETVSKVVSLEEVKFDDLTFTDIEKILVAFKEVNSSFFKMVTPHLPPQVRELIQALGENEESQD